MKFDLRDHGNPETPFMVLLDGRIIRRVVAFDTDAGTVERLTVTWGHSLIVLAHLPEDEAAKYGNLRGLALPVGHLSESESEHFGNFRGLATTTEHGKQVQVWGLIESQDTLDAQAGRWA
jgi:hypothetical protein